MPRRKPTPIALPDQVTSQENKDNCLQAVQKKYEIQNLSYYNKVYAITLHDFNQASAASSKRRAVK